jgi:hypothetical protein
MIEPKPEMRPAANEVTVAPVPPVSTPPPPQAAATTASSSASQARHGDRGTA